MKAGKRLLSVMLGFMMAGTLLGCQEKVITVADIQTESEYQVTYVEMKEIELKEVVEDDGKEVIAHCAVLIPYGYHESKEVPGMYVHERAPMESSNIYYSVASGEEGNGSGTLTKEQYKESIEAAYEAAGMPVELEITSFEETDMDGIPAYKIRSSYKSGENTILQLTYMILAKDTHTITYSQSKDDEMMADFEVAEGEIRLVK